MSETKTKKRRTYSRKKKREGLIDKAELTLSDIIPVGGAGPVFVDGVETEFEPIMAKEPVEKINMQNSQPVKFLQGKISPRPIPVKKKHYTQSDLPTRRK